MDKLSIRRIVFMYQALNMMITYAPLLRGICYYNGILQKAIIKNS
jgi:hypothetical protein